MRLNLAYSVVFLDEACNKLQWKNVASPSSNTKLSSLKASNIYFNLSLFAPAYIPTSS